MPLPHLRAHAAGAVWGGGGDAAAVAVAAGGGWGWGVLLGLLLSSVRLSHWLAVWMGFAG